MKLTLSLSLLVVFFATSINLKGQKEVTVINQKVQMSKGEQPAYIVEIHEAFYESTLKHWKKLIRQNTKSKVEDVGHEHVILGTSIIEIYEKPINIYSALIPGDSSIKLIAVFEIDSVFFDINTVEKSVETEKTHSQIQLFLRRFAVEQYSNTAQEELELEMKGLKDFNKELANLTKENESLLKDIKENEQDIKNSEDQISSLEMDNTRKQDEINSKKEAISGINNDPDLLDQAKDQLKSLEKEKKGIEGKLEKEQKNIVKYQANIQSANLDVERNLEKQEMKKDEITKQETKVESLKKIQEGIK